MSRECDASIARSKVEPDRPEPTMKNGDVSTMHISRVIYYLYSTIQALCAPIPSF